MGFPPLGMFGMESGMVVTVGEQVVFDFHAQTKLLHLWERERDREREEGKKERERGRRERERERKERKRERGRRERERERKRERRGGRVQRQKGWGTLDR